MPIARSHRRCGKEWSRLCNFAHSAPAPEEVLYLQIPNVTVLPVTVDYIEGEVQHILSTGLLLQR